MVRLSAASDVTDSTGLAVPASELNAALEGTLANKVGALDECMHKREILFEGTKKGITYEVSVYGKIGIYYVYADNSLDADIPSGNYYTFAPGEIIPEKYRPKNNYIYNAGFLTLLGKKAASIGINQTNGWFGFGWVYETILKNDKFYAQLIWSFD